MFIKVLFLLAFLAVAFMFFMAAASVFGNVGILFVFPFVLFMALMLGDALGRA